MLRIVATLIVLVTTTSLALASLYFALNPDTADQAGWWQVFLGALSVPVLLYELDRIRQALTLRPELSIGLAGVGDLPLSSIRSLEVLPTTVTVSQGYAHFYLVIRNHGKVAAKHVKIHLEHERNPSRQSSLLFPVVRVSEFSSDKPSFKPENNVDFVFTGGADWSIYPNDCFGTSC